MADNFPGLAHLYAWVCRHDAGNGGFYMFLGIAGVLFLLWIVGEVFTHGASLAIHILAIVWVISLIGHFIGGRKG